MDLHTIAKTGKLMDGQSLLDLGQGRDLCYDSLYLSLSSFCLYPSLPFYLSICISPYLSFLFLICLFLTLSPHDPSLSFSLTSVYTFLLLSSFFWQSVPLPIFHFISFYSFYSQSSVLSFIGLYFFIYWSILSVCIPSSLFFLSASLPIPLCLPFFPPHLSICIPLLLSPFCLSPSALSASLSLSSFCLWLSSSLLTVYHSFSFSCLCIFFFLVVCMSLLLICIPHLLSPVCLYSCCQKSSWA